MADGESAVTLIRGRATICGKCLLMQFAAAPGKAAKYDAGQRGRRRQRFYRRGDRNFGGSFCWKSEDAGRNRGKRHRFEIVVTAKLDRTAIARGEMFILPTMAAVPDRPNGMDHMPRWKEISLGDFGVAGFAAIERAALGQQLGPGRVMDCAIDAAPAEQRRIRGVDDGVNAQACDVGNDDFQPRLTDLARQSAQAEAAALTVTPLSANSCCNSPAWNISRMMSQPPTNSPLT
jgi:hypothetical protein